MLVEALIFVTIFIPEDIAEFAGRNVEIRSNK
jgi:hypothetical protein